MTQIVGTLYQFLDTSQFASFGGFGQRKSKISNFENVAIDSGRQHSGTCSDPQRAGTSEPWRFLPMCKASRCLFAFGRPTSARSSQTAIASRSTRPKRLLFSRGPFTFECVFSRTHSHLWVGSSGMCANILPHTDKRSVCAKGRQAQCKLTLIINLIVCSKSSNHHESAHTSRGDSKRAQFVYDQVSGKDSTQESVFESVGKPMCESVLQGTYTKRHSSHTYTHTHRHTHTNTHTHTHIHTH